MTLDIGNFDGIADETLNHLLDVIDDQLGDRFEVDMENGMLTIETDTGGHYIINKHGPNRQIWLSSPVSGASHYEFNEDSRSWVDTRSGESLTLKLSEELSGLAGVAFTLD